MQQIDPHSQSSVLGANGKYTWSVPLKKPNQSSVVAKKMHHIHIPQGFQQPFPIQFGDDRPS
jgi:hypothetical protein